jgi:hypothetical protein
MEWRVKPRRGDAGRRVVEAYERLLAHAEKHGEVEMRFAREIFGFTEVDWTSADRLRAKVHGAVARYRVLLTSPEHGCAAVEGLHDALTEALAAEGIPDPEAVALGLLLQALDQAGIEPPG